jgi:MarR family transcriptional regulator, 2-MHQ and catechol-resistance regulon repressor
VLEYGLTIPQFGIMEALYHLGPLSLGELADKLLVSGGNVTYVMDRLEEQGLVYRQRSDLDRRVIEARLTDEGRALIDRSSRTTPASSGGWWTTWSRRSSGSCVTF